MEKGQAKASAQDHGGADLVTVDAVLAGTASYDALSPDQQPEVRTVWAQRMEEARSVLNFADSFQQAGEAYSELDAEGNVVVRGARGA